jgi:hypothetical protein
VSKNRKRTTRLVLSIRFCHHKSRMTDLIRFSFLVKLFFLLGKDGKQNQIHASRGAEWWNSEIHSNLSAIRRQENYGLCSLYLLSVKGSRNQWGIMKRTFEGEDLESMRGVCFVRILRLRKLGRWRFVLSMRILPQTTERYEMVVCWKGTTVWYQSKISPGAAHLLRSWVWIPPGTWIFVCCECRVLSGRGLCDELITPPEESYRMCCVVVCDLETSRIGAPHIYDISNLRVNIQQLYALPTYLLNFLLHRAEFFLRS